VPASSDAQLLELVGEVQGLLELSELREGLIVALARAVPSDWVSINEISPDPQRLYTVVRPELPARQHEMFARLAHENPLIARFNRTADTRPYRISDIVSVEEFHALALYREFYAEIGLEHQIAFVVKVSTDSYVGIAFSRRTRDFSDAERDLLDRARPFLIQIYRNALAYGALAGAAGPGRPMIERLLERGLTRREAAVLSGVAHGASNADVASALAVSERTVGKHLQHCYHKLGVANRSAAAALAWTLARE
jgi:DNA-binding CsgD family transcriptional regulator